MPNGMDAGSASAVSKPHSSNTVSPGPGVRRSTWLERRLIQWTFEKSGRPRLEVVLWDGTVLGETHSPAAKILLRTPRALRRLIWNPALAFGECYADGDLEVHGDLRTVFVEVNRGLSHVRPGRQWTLLRRSHSLSNSKFNVHHHYDLGNDFYLLWLDEQLVYTCAYYPHPNATLEQAQVAKLDYVCRKLRLKPGDRVAEAGCGWGAMAMHMARNYGATVEAYNLSHEQIAYARQRASAEGLTDRVTFIEDDYRSMKGEFDAFVSVGMLEHVGPEKYRQMGALISRILKPSGRGLIHTIGRNVARPLDPWTDKYIFPGARPPSLREMMDLFEDARFSVLDVENLRLHYSRTCADWLQRFEQVADRVAKMFGDRFVRMWRFYLAASSATFETGDLQLFQVLFARRDCNSLPWTRSDWYAKPI